MMQFMITQSNRYYRLNLVYLAIFICVASAHADEEFNAPAIKINERTVSVREVEKTFSDSLVLIQDKLRKGELSRDALPEAIKIAWNEAVEVTTQDKILDYRAEKLKKEIMKNILDHAGAAGVTGERAIDYFNREVAYATRRMRHDMIVAAGGEDELRKALKRRDETLREWEEGITLELFRQEVLRMEFGPVSVSPGYVKQFYDKHPEMFTQPDAWRLRRIRLKKSAFSSPEVALKAANLAREKILAGTDFASVASKVSDDPDYAGSGGMLVKEGNTDLPSGTFPGEEQLCEKLKDGEITEPVDAGDWYVLVQRVSYTRGVTQMFDKAADRAQALAYNEKLRQRKREMYEKLKNESYIEILQPEPPARILKQFKESAGFFVAP